MKTKQIFLTIALAIISMTINAQDKYEFLIIEYSTWFKQVSVSIDGKVHTKEKVDLPKEDRFINSNPLLKKVSEYQESGWELMNFSTVIGGNNNIILDETFFAYMRKKKVDKK